MGLLALWPPDKAGILWEHSLSGWLLDRLGCCCLGPLSFLRIDFFGADFVFCMASGGTPVIRPLAAARARTSLAASLGSSACYSQDK